MALARDEVRPLLLAGVVDDDDAAAAASALGDEQLASVLVALQRKATLLPDFVRLGRPLLAGVLPCVSSARRGTRRDVNAGRSIRSCHTLVRRILPCGESRGEPQGSDFRKGNNTFAFCVRAR